MAAPAERSTKVFVGRETELDTLFTALDQVRAGRPRVVLIEVPSASGLLLELLSDLDRKRPVVLAVDDAHWADLDSLRALLFALRRLVVDRVLTLLTVRPEDMTRLPDGLRRLADGQTGTTIQLSALDASQVRALAKPLGLNEFRTARHGGCKPTPEATRCRGRRSNAPIWPATPATATAPATRGTSGAFGSTCSPPRTGCRSSGAWPTPNSVNAR
jgi:hypothetical protein